MVVSAKVAVSGKQLEGTWVSLDPVMASLLYKTFSFCVQHVQSVRILLLYPLHVNRTAYLLLCNNQAAADVNALQ